MGRLRAFEHAGATFSDSLNSMVDILRHGGSANGARIVGGDFLRLDYSLSDIPSVHVRALNADKREHFAYFVRVRIKSLPSTAADVVSFSPYEFAGGNMRVGSDGALQCVVQSGGTWHYVPCGSLSIGVWHSICASGDRDAGTLTIYVDGAKAGELTGWTPSDYGMKYFYPDPGYKSGIEYLDLKELVFFPFSLLAEDAAALHVNRVFRFHERLAHDWRCDQPHAKDSIGGADVDEITGVNTSNMRRHGNFSALRFNGSNESIGMTSFPKPHPFSLAALIKADTQVEPGDVGIVFGGTGGYGWGLAMKTDGVRKIYARVSGAAGPSNDIYGTPLSEFIHRDSVMWLQLGDKLEVAKDGEPAYSQDATVENAGTTSFKFGIWGDYPDYFTGDIARVRLFDRPLSPLQRRLVAQEMRRGI